MVRQREEQHWCMKCGELIGRCLHNEGITDNISTAYSIWLKYNNKRLSKKPNKDRDIE